MRPKMMRTLSRTLGIAAALWLVAAAASAQQDLGLLKVCKVAGPGVPVGTVFTFTADTRPPFTVVAGPGPGSFCTV
jgi:hypothetical protein